MNIDEYLSRQLKEGEVVVKAIRRHPIVLVPSVGLGTLIIMLDFFLVAWWFQHRAWGAWGFVLVLLIGGWFIFRGLFEWAHNVLVITSGRLIDINQRGFFNRNVAEATFEKIQDVQITIKGLWQTVFQFGSIVVKTAGAGSTLDIHGIRQPQEVQHIITDTQQRHQPAGQGDLSADELVGLVDQLRRRIGPDEFNRLIKKQPPPS